MKKVFEDARVELIHLQAADIITASTGVGGAGGGKDSGDYDVP